jgi:hypothetical protein
MSAISQTREVDCDLLVIGSGAAGLSAAVTAAWHGLKVTVVEKDPVFGGATDFDRHRRVDVQEKLKSLARQTPVQTDGILGKQREGAAVASASFGGGIAAIDDGDVQAAIAHRRPEMIGRRCAGQPCADDQHVHGWEQCRRRLIIRQRMPGAKREGLIADGQRNSLCRSDSNAPEELFKQLPGSGSESAIALQGLELAPYRRACGVLAVSRDQLSGERRSTASVVKTRRGRDDAEFFMRAFDYTMH